METDDRSPVDALCYAYNRGGINNQKIALFGLFLRAAQRGPRRLVCPDLICFDQVTFRHARVSLRSCFKIEPLLDFAAAHHLDVLDREPLGDEGGWDYFLHGDNYLPYAALSNELTSDSITCDFFRALVPKMRRPDLLQRTIGDAFGQRGIDLVLQLRIEKDWSFHIEHRLKPIIGDLESTTVSFQEIVTKLKQTIGDRGSAVYVVCDEAALLQPKNEIQDTVKKDFGIDMFWKSDFLSVAELGELSLLDLSLFDFEMAVAAQTFVGTTRSTFSNMVALEKYARTRAPTDHHYIYNLRGSSLALRRDNGAFSIPTLAAASDPWDPAHGFHQAQIFQTVGKLERARELYAAYAARDGVDTEEVYASLYRIAQIETQLGFSASDVIASYVRATQILPSRAEAWYGASRHARLNNDFGVAYDLSKPAIGLDVPHGKFVERWIYDWALLDEHAVSASWVGRYRESLDASLEILARGTAPKDQQARIAGNAKFSLERFLIGVGIGG